MGQIQEMERGRLCPMRGGRYFNHQTWDDGRNVVRYVPAEQVPALQKSIAEYRRFMALAEQYVALIVRQTRQRQARQKAPSAPISRSMASPRPKKGQKKEE